jgi:hypothetical protein
MPAAIHFMDERMSDEKTLPEYLTEGEGHIDIKLRRAITIDGTKVTSLRMREPDLNDQLVFEATKGTDAIKEATLIANLCDITVDQAKTLKLHDWKRAQEALGNLIG